MNYYRCGFAPPNDRMEIIENNSNIPFARPQFESPRLAHVYRPRFYPRYSRSMRPYVPSHQGNFSVFNNMQIPGRARPSRGSCSPYDYNFHLKNDPNYSRQFGPNDDSMTYLSPSDLQHKVRGYYNTEESVRRNLYKEAFIENHHTHFDPQGSDIKAFTDLQTPNGKFYDQHLGSNDTELQSMGVSSNHCNTTRNIDFSVKEIQSIAHSKEIATSESFNSPISPADASTKISNEVQIKNFVEENPSTTCNSETTSENRNEFEDLEKALCSSDENSLAVYFLKHAFPNSGAENPQFDLDLSSLTCSSENYNTNSTEVAPVNSEVKDLTKEILNISAPTFLPEIIDGNFSTVSDQANENLNDLNLINDLQTTITKENPNCNEFTNKSDQQSVSKSENANTFSESEVISDNQQHKNEIVDPFEFLRELNNCKSNNKCLDCKNSSKSGANIQPAQQEFIFHAPIINISQQNQISTNDPSIHPQTPEQSFDVANLSKFNNNLYHYFLENLMKMLSFLQNSAKTYPQENQLENTCKEQERTSSTDEKCLSSSPDNNVTKLSKPDLISVQGQMSPELPSVQILKSFTNENSSYNCKISNTFLANESVSESLIGKNCLDHLTTQDPFSILDYDISKSILERNSDTLCSEILPSGTEHKFVQSNGTDPISSTQESNGSDFIYSSILNSEGLSDHMETSLSSLTNYLLDEPIDARFNFNREIFDVDECIRPSVHHNVPKRTKRKGKNSEAENHTVEMKTSTLNFDNIIPEVADASMKLLENIFESDTEECSSSRDMQYKVEKKNQTNNGSKKYGKRKNICKTSNSHFLHASFINKKNIKRLRRDLYCDAATQTYVAEFEPSFTKYACKNDAQTQWDSSDFLSKKFEDIFKKKEETFKKKYPQRSCAKISKKSRIDAQVTEGNFSTVNNENSNDLSLTVKQNNKPEFETIRNKIQTRRSGVRLTDEKLNITITTDMSLSNANQINVIKLNNFDENQNFKASDAIKAATGDFEKQPLLSMDRKLTSEKSDERKNRRNSTRNISIKQQNIRTVKKGESERIDFGNIKRQSRATKQLSDIIQKDKQKCSMIQKFVSKSQKRPKRVSIRSKKMNAKAKH